MTKFNMMTLGNAKKCDTHHNTAESHNQAYNAKCRYSECRHAPAWPSWRQQKLPISIRLKLPIVKPDHLLTVGSHHLFGQ
jgi:hypothetical protein